MPSPALNRLILSSHPPPAFLAPCLASIKRPSSTPQTALFSTTQTASYPRDYNRNRGVSALRRTGVRQPLSVSKEPLPQPVLDPKKRDSVKVDKDHGLWGFFNPQRTTLSTPEEDSKHGISPFPYHLSHPRSSRAGGGAPKKERTQRETGSGPELTTSRPTPPGRPWTVQELRHKSWEDLHSLWWVCARERNRLATEGWERNRLKAGYGDHEAVEREGTVRRTQRAIKHVLTERFYAWQEARHLAKSDPEVDLAATTSGEGAGEGTRAYRSEVFESYESLGVGGGVEGRKGTVAL